MPAKQPSSLESGLRFASNAQSRTYGPRDLSPNLGRTAAAVRAIAFIPRRLASRDSVGDDARVRGGSPTAGADLRFARPVGDVRTCEINGQLESGRRDLDPCSRVIGTPSACCRSAKETATGQLPLSAAGWRQSD